MDGVFWLPKYDGSALPVMICDELLRRLNRRKPGLISIWEMSGSPILSLGVPPDFVPLEAAGIFMAGVTDPSLLLLDAKRIIEKRTTCPLEITVGGRSILIGRGDGKTVHAVMEANVLLGLLLGLRESTKDIDMGAVKFSPRKRNAVEALETAFPPHRFWIEGVWWAGAAPNP